MAIICAAGSLLCAADAAALFAHAQALERSGNLKAAEQAWRDVLRADPASAEAHANLGVLLARRQNYAAAIEQYRHAMRLKPELEAVRINLGLALLKSGQAAVAADELTRYLASQPGDRRVIQLLANALLEIDRYEEAARQFERLLPEADSSVRLGLATAYTRLGRRAEAESVFEVVLREDNSAAVQLAVGQAYLAANDFTSASEAFERARKLDPHLPGLHFAIGASFWKQQRAADAIAAWREELKTEPGSFETNFALGAALVERSRFDEGERRLSAARSLRPDHAPTLYYLGRIAWKRRGPEALTLVRRSVELDGSNRAARYLLAQIYTARGWKQAAAREFAAVRALSNRQVDEDVDILSSARK